MNGRFFTKNIIIFILFLCTLILSNISCDSKKNNHSDIERFVPIDSGINYVVFKLDTSQKRFFDNIYKLKPTTLNKEEIKLLETLLCESHLNYKHKYDSLQKILELNDTIVRDSNYYSYNERVIDLDDCIRQFIPYINEKNEKVVFVSCSPKEDQIDSLSGRIGLWKRNWIKVMDGGGAYFRLDINLTKKTYTSISTNGSA